MSFAVIRAREAFGTIADDATARAPAANRDLGKSHPEAGQSPGSFRR
jgi:hypothetical protein